MAIFFEVIKAVFFAFTVALGIFHLRGDMLGISDPLTDMLKTYMMPGYMLFCGIMLGYLIAHVRAGTEGAEHHTQKIYIQSFLIGIVLGILLSFAYMYV